MKTPATLLCYALASTVRAVGADRFMPFGENPFGPNRPQIREKFLRHERISCLEPTLEGEQLQRLLATCPGPLDIIVRVTATPGGTAQHEVDIDNDAPSGCCTARSGASRCQ